MHVDFLYEVFLARRDDEALVWRDRSYSYGWLLDAVKRWKDDLLEQAVAENSVVSLLADFSPNAVALLIALVDHGCVAVPLSYSVGADIEEFQDIAQVEHRIVLDAEDKTEFDSTGRSIDHPLLREIRDRRHPGLVLFSSGSTGKSKAALHDFVPLLDKFKVPRHTKRTIAFLLFDHIGGINTLLYTLFNGGCAVVLEDRTPDAVCHAVERHAVQLLPTSPTFLNLLLLSGALERHDLGSLETVTYGTEAMPETTLVRLHEALPRVRLLQTYGLSEIGILRSKSRSSDSLWMKIGGEGIELRVVDGLLQVKTPSAMLGYLNAPSPFTEDGWFETGDAVEVDGEYFRILGRQSDIINVGGQKVYPAEVETAILAMPGVEDVTVKGIPSPITGRMVQAAVRLREHETLAEFRKRMRAFLKNKLPAFKIPQKVVLTDESLHGERFKKTRAEVPR